MESHNNSYSFADVNTQNSILPGDSDDEFEILETTTASGCDREEDKVLTPFNVGNIHEMQALLKSRISQFAEPKLPKPVNNLDLEAVKLSISPDTSFEEIQKHIEDLIKDNENLKNVISQNNIAMKTQFDRFISYKDEVEAVMNDYKGKFNDAKLYIDKLKQDNMRLVSEVEVYMNLKKLHEEEILSLKERITRMEDVDLAKEASIALEIEVDGPTKIQQLTTENEKLKIQIQTLTEYQTKLNQEVEDLHQENSKLSTEIKKNPQLVQTTDKIPKLEDQLQTKQQEINVLQFDVTAFRDEIARLRNENEKQKAQLIDDSEKLSFESQLNEQTKMIENLNQQLIDSKFCQSSLAQEITSLKSQLKNLQDAHNPLLQEEHEHLRKQLSVAQAKLTDFEVQKERDIAELRRGLSDEKNKTDEIFVLKEQLAIYRSDFDAERESREAVKKEKAQLAEDIKNLQTRNRQLQNEIEDLRNKYEPKPEGYNCPKCSFSFNNYQTLENHVHRCLELDGFP